MHINARNIACLLSYVVFCFERLKYVQTFNLNYLRTEELVYIQNW